MTESHREVLHHTKEQVGNLIQHLTTDHCLPRTPTKDSFWYRLGEAVTQSYLACAERVAAREGKAIIMAGPPGAGKSQGVTAVQGALGPERSQQLGVMENGFITIDADDVKQLLLGNPVPGLEVDPDLLAQARHHWDTMITEHSPAPLADGKPLLRGELSTLVHPLSTATADNVRKRLVATKTNIKIEGTLQWMDPSGAGQGPRLIAELEAKKYKQVTIVAVDAPQEICLEGAHHRWAEPRSKGDASARYTPIEAVKTMFTPGNATSRCIDNARITHNLARNNPGFEQVNLFIAHRGPQPVVEHVNHNGASRVIPIKQQSPGPREPATRPHRYQTAGVGHRNPSRARPPGLGR